MATVENPSRSHSVADVAQASQRVLDPLRRLRGYIRLYVTLEAAAIVLLYAAACFWLSLLVDYGAFKNPVYALDWVQILPRWARILVTMGFIAGLLFIVVRQALLRLLRQFSDVALALELERRFHKILGDRLITAIELADRKKIIEQGYSSAMVDETIVEAAERVEKLPIKEVFHWKRLWVMALLIFFSTFVLYFLVGGAFYAGDYLSYRGQLAAEQRKAEERKKEQEEAKESVRSQADGSKLQSPALLASFGNYHDVISIWFERNILWRNTIWPRKAHLVFLEPDTASFRIGRDKPTPAIRVRAYEYVLADTRTSEGWRLLTWGDLETNKHLLAVAPAVAPSDWKVRDESIGLTVDEVNLLFQKFDIRKGTPVDAVAGKQEYLLPGGTRLPYQWAIAEAKSEEGWRPLAWKDLNSAFLNGFTVPALSTGWKPPLTPNTGYSIDEVEQAMSESGNTANPALADVRNVLAQLNRLNDMRQTLDQVDARVADGSLRRTMRKLIVPQTVTVDVTGLTTRNSMTLAKQEGNEFTGQFGELKEKPKDLWNFDYAARGEDYTTQTRRLTIVPPPSLAKLSREDEQPAYLYYRPNHLSDAKDEDVKGKKQPIERHDVTLQGGDVALIDCFAGTNLTLIGEADKELVSVELHQLEGGASPVPEVKFEGMTFSFTLPDVRQDRLFEVVMLDKDNVTGKRKLRIRVTRDSEPDVSVTIADWMHMDNKLKAKDGGIMVTPKARIPFDGSIKDDHGLTKVNYAYTITKVESTAVLDVKALFASGVAGMMTLGGGPLPSTTFLAGALDEFEKAKKTSTPDNKEVLYYPSKNVSIQPFDRRLKDQASRGSEFLPLVQIQELLSKRQLSGFRNLYHEHKVDPDPMTPDVKPDALIGDFALPQNVLLASDGKVQPRYRISLWVEATDTDLDSTRAVDGYDGPKTGTSKERFQLLVVSEEDLLIALSQEEEDQSRAMSNVVDTIQEVQQKLSQLQLDLGSLDLKPENLSPLSVRAESLDEAITRAQGQAKEVLQKYQSIFRVLKANDLPLNKLKLVAEEIIRPLQDVDIEFVDAKNQLQNLRKQLDAKNSFNKVKEDSSVAARSASKQMQELLDKVQAILDKMQKQIELSKLIEDFRRIEKSEEHIFELVKIIRDLREQQLLDDALKGTKP